MNFFKIHSLYLILLIYLIVNKSNGNFKIKKYDNEIYLSLGYYYYILLFFYHKFNYS